MSEKKMKNTRRSLRKLQEFYINQYVQVESFLHRFNTAMKIIFRKKVSFKVSGE